MLVHGGAARVAAGLGARGGRGRGAVVVVVEAPAVLAHQHVEGLCMQLVAERRMQPRRQVAHEAGSAQQQATQHRRDQEEGAAGGLERRPRRAAMEQLCNTPSRVSNT